MSAFRKMKLGAFLIMQKAVTEQQLKEALDAQRILGGKLGTNLIELGHISEAALGKMLAKKFGIPSIDLSRKINVDPKVLAKIMPDDAVRYQVFPLGIKDRRFILLMADPNDMAALNEMEFSLGMPIRPVVASELTVFHLLEKYYGVKREPRYVELEAKMQKEILEEARKRKEEEKRPTDEKVIMIREVAPQFRKPAQPSRKAPQAQKAQPAQKAPQQPALRAAAKKPPAKIDFSSPDGLSFDD